MNNKYFLLLLSIMVAGITSCDKPTKEQKEADALFQQITKVYTLQEDGSLNYHYQHELDLHSYYSFNRLYGETFIIYNPDYQELKINKSVTTMADGKKVPSPDNAFNEVLPHFALGAPPYSNLREMVVTHTGLERNSTVNLDYELKSKKGFMPFLMEDELLVKQSPIRKLIVKVQVPKNKKLNYILLNSKEKLNISNKGDLKEYKWTFEDLPAIQHENNQPAYNQHLPRLIFSTADMEKAYTYLSDQISKDIPESIKGSLKTTLEDKETKLDSALAIQDMVVHHINHFEIPLKFTGYTLKSNDQVISDNGGTTLEKTALLSSLLQQIGVKAEITSIIPSDYYSEDMGNLNTPEHFFVKMTNDNNEELYLSALKDYPYNPKYQFSNAKEVVLEKPGAEKAVSDIRAKQSKVSVKGDLDLKNKQTLSGSIEYQSTYCEFPYFQVEQNEDYVKSLLSPGINTNAIKSFTISRFLPSEIEASYEIAQTISPEEKNDLWFFAIPEVNTGLDQWHLSSLASKRQEPVEIGWPLAINYDYTLAIPENYKLASQAFNENISNEAGTMTVRIEENEEEILIQKELKIKDDIIAAGQFNDLMELIHSWSKQNYQQLVFREMKEE